MKLDMVDLVIMLAKSVPDNKACLNLKSSTDTDKAIESNTAISFMWVGNMNKPIYQFWRLFKEGKLAHDCHVVFTDIVASDPGWTDLETAFGGTRFGTLFLMRVSEHAHPPVLPSQLGLYKR